MAGGADDRGASSGGDDPLPEDGVRRDVRVSRHQDLGVEVTRDLTSQGRLARGSGTNMSRLSFRVGAAPRQERDPELEALREEPAPQRVAEARVPEAPPSEEPTPAAEAPAPAPAGAVGRMFRKLFGRDRRA